MIATRKLLIFYSNQTIPHIYQVSYEINYLHIMLLRESFVNNTMGLRY